MHKNKKMKISEIILKKLNEHPRLPQFDFVKVGVEESIVNAPLARVQSKTPTTKKVRLDDA
jgi:hypothetical protein